MVGVQLWFIIYIVYTHLHVFFWVSYWAAALLIVIYFVFFSQEIKYWANVELPHSCLQSPLRGSFINPQFGTKGWLTEEIYAQDETI